MSISPHFMVKENVINDLRVLPTLLWIFARDGYTYAPLNNRNIPESHKQWEALVNSATSLSRVMTDYFSHEEVVKLLGKGLEPHFDGIPDLESLTPIAYKAIITERYSNGRSPGADFHPYTYYNSMMLDTIAGLGISHGLARGIYIRSYTQGSSEVTHSLRAGIHGFNSYTKLKNEIQKDFPISSFRVRRTGPRRTDSQLIVSNLVLSKPRTPPFSGLRTIRHKWDMPFRAVSTLPWVDLEGHLKFNKHIQSVHSDMFNDVFPRLNKIAKEVLPKATSVTISKEELI